MYSSAVSGMPSRSSTCRRTRLIAGRLPTTLSVLPGIILVMRLSKGSATEGVERVPERQRLGVDKVERAVVEAVEVGDVVHRAGHEIDRHEVERAALRAHEGSPLRELAAQRLDQLEGVV